MPWRQVVSWYRSWRHELVNDRCPMNSAGTAGPIRTRDGSFDAPERRNDDGSGHVALRATWHVPRAAAWTLRKMLSGLQPKREVAVTPNFQVRSALVWIVCHSANQPRGVKIVPPGGNIVFFSLMPSSSDTLRPRDPKFGTRVHVSKGYPNMHNLGGFQKLGGQDFGFLVVSGLFFFLHNSSKNVNDIFWKFEILTPYFFTP